MSQFTLRYFDVDGGRAEPIRLALSYGGIAFEDYRFPYSVFEQERKQTPLNQVPVLTIDDKVITQSNAILRFVGKQTNLYPQDLFQALICDEVMDAVEDCIDKIVSTFALTGDALKTAREQLIANDLTMYLKFLQAKLIQQGGEYFAGQRLTIADLKVMPLIGWLNRGVLDHIPSTLIAELAPELNAHAERVLSDEKIKAYYQARQQ
ncbi:hypothetical protein tinsulaeT_36880 [Thalassotalea insulae]|uniref:Glutathione S-transferase n=1 Tax=Thalassotalea insulae TaxID=2056778 RepID=A0ABQ6GWN1_9GAMM|nr:glutathione S-transferase family protein [Thalassotalea insulae]GLX80348.1 hypothetical protein tinsulaeT_36880 [Thalassotalea insulae]